MSRSGAVRRGLDLVSLRQPTVDGVEAWFALQPGERELVALGETVARGAPLAEQVRDARTSVVAGPTGPDGTSGRWWSGVPGHRRGADERASGELLFRSSGRWRLATGDPAEPLDAPFGGTVVDLRPGAGLRLRTPSRGLLGAITLGGPSSGRLLILAPRDGQVRPSEIDVGSSGAVLVVGSSIDAESITRARAVGVRGIVVAGLGVKERREVVASERRARAGIHRLPPFAILILEGTMDRPISTPIMSVLEAIEGQTVAIVSNPACLVFDAPEAGGLRAAPDLVRVTGGPLAGLEGTWGGLAGPYRFAGGVILEAGWVHFGTREPVALPLGDLERFV